MQEIGVGESGGRGVWVLGAVVRLNRAPGQAFATIFLDLLDACPRQGLLAFSAPAAAKFLRFCVFEAWVLELGAGLVADRASF